MITGVFGLPGAGKSTFLAACACDALAGRDITVGHLLWKTKLNSQTKYEKVYCNFPIYGTYQFNFDDLGVKLFENCLILIDEIMLLCDSRNWKTFSENVKSFIALHRHYNVDIIYCSQRYNDCDIKIRALTQQFCLMEKQGQYTKITPLIMYQRVQMGSISEGYEMAAPLGCSRLRRSRYYWAFDSFARPEYPPVVCALWTFDDVQPPASRLSVIRGQTAKLYSNVCLKLRVLRPRRRKVSTYRPPETPLETHSDAS